MTETEPDPHRMIRKLNLIGLAITVLLIGGVGGWATATQLAGAVIAPGSVVVELNIKKVQHPTGGVVGEILVREGAEVQDGQVVLRLDDTVTRATLGAVRSQLEELLAREARLLAERDDGDTIAFPAQLTKGRGDPSVAVAMAGEEKLFESRRTARTGQRSQLRERIAQMNEEIRGLSAQLAAKETELSLIAQELVGVSDLYKKNLGLHFTFHAASARPDETAGRTGFAHCRYRAGARQDQRNRAADNPARSGFSDRSPEGFARIAGQDRGAQGTGHGSRGPAQACRSARAADRFRPPADGAHRRRRDQQWRDHHADRAACR